MSEEICMKKILCLIIIVGLFTLLHTSKISYAQISANNLQNLSNNGENSKPEQSGPPWYNEGWNYRKPIIVTNNGDTLLWYQVLVKLDAGNFNFAEAKNDGSDIRFTYSDGTTELNYWIESWDSNGHLAYIWVRVPNIAMGNNTIYLYYNNPAASAASNGNSTFDSFENDWSQFATTGNGQPAVNQDEQVSGAAFSPFLWITLSGTPTASGGVLSLADGDGIRSTSTYLYNAVGMLAKFGLGNGMEWGGFINGASGSQTMVGDLTSDHNNLFLIDYVTGFDTVLFPRVGDEDWHNAYHIFELRWKPNHSLGDIDHGFSSAASTLLAQVPSTSLPVTLYSFSGSGATLLVDWVYVRQYRDPEPTFAVGGEQGLVALSIDVADSPDPVRINQSLTYQLTILNTSEINAPGVVVTDTLPANVQLGPISASQGSCIPGSVILCNLNTIFANSTAWITINVTPTVDGEITNTAAVGSPGYELDLSDNTRIEETLIDSVAPIVTWVSPIGNGGIYHTTGGLVTLKVSATDNDQIEHVEFWWVNDGNYLFIDSVTTPPYSVLFDSNILNPGTEYFFEARVYDRAGNSNYPGDRKYIYIKRLPAFFLPLIIR
jgi:uncharacterized repeat protein (TIGR01451 family)